MQKMFSFFKPPKKMVGYKITNVERTKRYGVAATSLIQLMEKSCARFQLENCRVYMAKDGAEITDEDYFATIEPQTLLIIAAPHIHVKTDFELMYDAIRLRNASLLDVADMIKDFVNENRKEFVKILTEIDKKSQEAEDKTAVSLRSEHKEWFDGQDAKCNTKEEAMARRAQDRIRGYYYKTKDEITKNEFYKSNLKARKVFDRILKVFQYLLTGGDYFSTLFDRSYKRKHPSLYDHTDSHFSKRLKLDIQNHARKGRLFLDTKLSLCSEKGEFYCQGLWNKDDCFQSAHTINPYSNRESLILFQVWNLDHQIEISRSVLPSLIENVKILATDKAKCSLHNCKAIDVSVFQYFLELFTIKNLKLVHIVCHDKGTHDLKSKGHLICEKCKEYKKIQIFLDKINELEK